MRNLILLIALAAAPAAAQQHDAHAAMHGADSARKSVLSVVQGMAMVWAPYDFHASSKFSHCGVNNFQLARTAAGWKIIALVDTRQRTGCPGQP